MDRYFSNLPIKFCIVMVLSAVGSARADEALPSQDQALARALENHPDIVAAKAKVALAEAELYGKRMEVSRQVLGLYGSLKRLELQADVSKAALNQSKAEFERLKSLLENGKPEQSAKNKVAVEVQTAEAELVHAINQREQAEKELRLLIGTASPAANAKTSNTATAVARQMPQGPIVEKMKIAQEKPIKLDFVETPLEEIMAYSLQQYRHHVFNATTGARRSRHSQRRTNITQHKRSSAARRAAGIRRRLSRCSIRFARLWGPVDDEGLLRSAWLHTGPGTGQRIGHHLQIALSML